MEPDAAVEIRVLGDDMLVRRFRDRAAAVVWIADFPTARAAVAKRPSPTVERRWEWLLSDGLLICSTCRGHFEIVSGVQ